MLILVEATRVQHAQSRQMPWVLKTRVDVDCLEMFSLPGRRAKVKGTRRPKMDTITAPASKLEKRLKRLGYSRVYFLKTNMHVKIGS